MRRRTRKSVFTLPGCLLLLALALAAADGAGAYSYANSSNQPYYWDDGEIVMTFLPDDFPSGDDWTDAVIAAYRAWNNVPGVDLDFSHGFGQCSPVGYTDGVNCVSWADGSDLGDGVLGLTTLTWEYGEYINADLQFNEDLEWTLESDYFYGTYEPYVFQAVALHELGHVLGLGHEDAKIATMNSYYPGGGPIGPDFDIVPHGDDRWGERSLYGDSGDSVDLAATNYGLVQAGICLPIAPPEQVWPGAQTDFAFSIENLGNEDAGPFEIAIYLSSDRSITPSDRLLMTADRDGIDAHAAQTFKVTVEIPAGLPDQDAYFGFIVDSDDAVSESDETNNALAAVVKTEIGNGGAGDDDDSGDDDSGDDDSDGGGSGGSDSGGGSSRTGGDDDSGCGG